MTVCVAEGQENMMPHDEGEKISLSAVQIAELKKIGAHPVEIVLGPGDYLHINKSRFHTFVKVSPPLQERKVGGSLNMEIH